MWRRAPLVRGGPRIPKPSSSVVDPASRVPSLSLEVVVGFLMLMGIVAKNCIRLVDIAIGYLQTPVTAISELAHTRARALVMPVATP